jgi:hypothetical protein
MSSERIGGVHSFQCDSCSEYLETDERDFNTALSIAKGDGWVAYNLSGEWFHACPACKEVRR